MTHGKRNESQFRAGSLRRKAMKQAKENQTFEQETERLLTLYSKRYEGSRGKEAKS